MSVVGDLINREYQSGGTLESLSARLAGAICDPGERKAFEDAVTMGGLRIGEEVPSLRADSTAVRSAYDGAETLAEFGEWCATRLFGDTPEKVGPYVVEAPPAYGLSRSGRLMRLAGGSMVEKGSPSLGSLVHVVYEGWNTDAKVQETFQRDGVEWCSLVTDRGTEFNAPSIYCIEDTP